MNYIFVCVPLRYLFVLSVGMFVSTENLDCMHAGASAGAGGEGTGIAGPAGNGTNGTQLLDGKAPASDAADGADSVVAIEMAVDELEYKLPFGLSAQEKFQTLLLATITGAKEDREEKRAELKRLVAAHKKDIRSKDFPGVSDSRKLVGPIRYVAERAGENKHELINWLLDNGFWWHGWHETDGALDEFCMPLSRDVATKLMASYGYKDATRNCKCVRDCCEALCHSNGYAYCCVCVFAVAFVVSAVRFANS